MTKTANPAADTGLPKTTLRRRPSKASLNTFMGKLFDPLPDAELADPGLARTEQKARRRNWDVGWYRVQAAYHAAQGLSNQCLVLVWGGSSGDELRQLRAAHDVAHATWVRERHRQIILVPAPTAMEVEWKRKHAHLGSGYIGEAAYAEQDKAIARDEARLGLASSKQGAQQ